MPYRSIDSFRNSEMNRKTSPRKISRVIMGQPMGPSQPEKFDLSARKKSRSIIRVLAIILFVHILIAGATFLNYKLTDTPTAHTNGEQAPPPNENSANEQDQVESTESTSGIATTNTAAPTPNSNQLAPKPALGVLPANTSSSITESPNVTVNIASIPNITQAQNTAQTTQKPAEATEYYTPTNMVATADDSSPESNAEIDAVDPDENDEITAVEIDEEPTATEAKTYLIVVGDSLSRIATKLNTTVEAIKRANPDIKNNTIYAGKKLNIPNGTTSTPVAATNSSSSASTATTSSSYTVKKGDYLFSIAKKHNMTLDKLLKLNNMTMSDANKLRPGQELKVTQSNN